MFYLLHGKDTYRSREKLNELIKHFKTKVSDWGFFRIDGENFNEAEFKELMKGKTLFEKKYVVVCDGVLKNKEAEIFMLSSLNNLAKTENMFLFLEEDVKEVVLGEFEKLAYKVQECKPLDGVKLRDWFAVKKIPANIAGDIIKKCGSDLWSASKEIEKYQLGGEVAKQYGAPEYNPFAICDAFAEKNKAKMWIIYQQALRQGIPAEEVFFKILWQIKNLLLVKKLINAGVDNAIKETGLHAFVASKAIKSAQKFSEEELENYSYEMLRIYHEERRGLLELPIEFEKLLICREITK
ncbi:MAG: hypothetical protein AAB818_02035 [Patescibacteria group bacterium]